MWHGDVSLALGSRLAACVHSCLLAAPPLPGVDQPPPHRYPQSHRERRASVDVMPHKELGNCWL